MIRFSVWLAEALNNLIPPQAIHRELEQDKLSIANYQVREYTEGLHIWPEFGPWGDLARKTVLDVGSGLGGKSAFYADLGASRVVGIDLRYSSVQSAVQLVRQRQLPQTHFLTGDAAEMPFPNECFDIVVSVNTLEHVDDLHRTLAECKRVVRSSGFLLLYFPPFYSPWGAHLEGWINFPWAHVFFTDKTLVEVARHVETRRHNNQQFILAAQVPWDQIDRLPALNRATVAQVLRLLQELDLQIVKTEMLPFAWHYLKVRGLLARSVLALLKWLCSLPLLQEVVTTKMVFVLKKKGTTA